jgi:hypothetical protein
LVTQSCGIEKTPPDFVKLLIMTKQKPRFVIKRAAAGLGFFTLDSIPNDTKIIEYIGLILTWLC